MIEDVTAFAMGIYAGFILFLIFEIFNIYRKIKRINIEVNKLQIKYIELYRNIEFINNSKLNKEVIEYFINELNKLNDSIKAKVDD